MFQKGSSMKADADKALCVARAQRCFCYLHQTRGSQRTSEHKATDIFSLQLLKPVTKGIGSIPPNNLSWLLPLH